MTAFIAARARFRCADKSITHTLIESNPIPQPLPTPRAFFRCADKYYLGSGDRLIRAPTSILSTAAVRTTSMLPAISSMCLPHQEDAAATRLDYAYDHLSRLSQFKHIPAYAGTTVLRSYSYDANGNILTFGPKTFSYYANTNRLSTDGSRGFSYDAKGRATAVAGVTLGYDIFDNMTAHGSHSYTYDAENQRLRKTEFGANKYYLSHNLQVYAEFTNDTAPDAEYVHGLGRMLAKYSPSEGYRFFYVDHLGSTRRMERDESSPNFRVDYYPYGEVLTQGGTDDTPYTFVQKELDAGTGLHYVWGRYYDPSIGRFPTVDPLWIKHPEVSPYAYVLNNPIKFFDPDGSAPKSVIRAGYAGVVFDKYLRVRNEVLAGLNQTAAGGGVTGFGAKALSTAIEFFTPASLVEQWNSSAIGLIGIGIVGPEGSGFKFKLTKSGKVDARSKLVRDARKTVEDAVAETKDVTQEFAQAKDALEFIEKHGGSKDADDFVSAVETALKTQNVKQGTKSFFKKILDIFKKEKDEIKD